MLFRLIGQAYERLHYEFDRARRILPTAVRFGVGQLNGRMTELWCSFERWSQSCDHTTSQAKKRRKKKVKRKTRKTPRK